VSGASYCCAKGQAGRRSEGHILCRRRSLLLRTGLIHTLVTIMQAKWVTINFQEQKINPVYRIDGI
jgi:hypothetical protein